MSEARTYGVSYGNGNDGVSQLFPDFYVVTDQPYRLALCAMVDQFLSDYQQRAKEACEVDGEAEYTIRATIYNPEDVEPEAPASADDEESDDEPEDDTSWSDVNGAWKIAEVFPVADEDVRDGRPFYDSLEEAISEPVLALTADEKE